MRDDQLKRLKEILLDLEYCAKADLEARLDALLPDDPELHAEALSLLRQDRDSRILLGPIDGLLPEALSDAPPPPVPARPPGEVGRQIGSYRLVEQLGAGGMGVVWRAEQLEPIRRNVALKILRGGWDTNALRLRFESERQSLARMDHPNIARIYDAGADELGQPFFVMELVDGVPISDFVRDRAISVDERLALFVPVCRAVQHAHQRGIIHRDLKPTNILVSVTDGQASPRIIDFGIAKTMDLDGVGSSFGTTDGQILGTLEYMSPEQAGGRRGEVDTRADIFSLGAILIELLTGEPPRNFSSSTLGESLRIVSETAIMVPTRTTSSGSLDVDLITIVRKATDPDPARRYESAGGLADDLERFRRSEPIAARPPDTAYQLRKLISRNRVVVVIAGIIGAALMAIGITLAVLLGAERRALQRAELEAERAEGINDFMSQVLASPAPGELGREVRVVDALDRALSRLGTIIQDRPQLRVSVERRMATTYFALGEEVRGDSLITAALALGRRVLRPDDSEFRWLLIEAGRFACRLGRYAQADSLLGQALQLVPTDRVKYDAGEFVMILSIRAVAVAALGRHVEAEEMTRSAIARGERDSLGIEMGTLHNRLGEFLRNQGRMEEARVEVERAVALLKSHGPAGELELADALGKLAITLDIGKEAARVDSLHAASLALYRKLKVDDMALAVELFNVAVAQILTGRFARAESLQLEAMELFEARMGRQNSVIATGLNNLGYCALCRDDPAAALRWLSEADTIGRRIGEVDANRGAALSNLTLALGALGRHEQALQTAREAASLRERLTPGGRHGLIARCCIGQAFLRAGQPESALVVLSDPESPEADPSAEAIHRLLQSTTRALCLADMGRTEEARAALQSLLPELLRTESPWLEVRDLRRAAAYRAERIGLPDEARALHRAVREMGRRDPQISVEE